MITFDEMVESQREGEIPSVVLALDPGETTGWAVFKGTELFDSGSLKTFDIETAVPTLIELIQHWAPEVLVIEEYRIYSWKIKQHANSDVFTLRLIGCIETLAVQSLVRLYKQSAQGAKNFCTDTKLKEWDMYVTGGHARDAVRHGAFFLIFNKQ